MYKISVHPRTDVSTLSPSIPPAYIKPVLHVIINDI